MSQEHRFCAEIYARLFSLIDRTRRVVVNPDGEAELPDCGEGETPPDLCFTFCGMERELRVEAKIVKNIRDVTLQPSQKLWCANLCPALAPQLWIVADRLLKQCWMFEHDAIAAKVRGRTGQSAPLNLWPNETPPVGCNLDELALKIITWATKHLSDVQDSA
jgi:hypothetical protein